MCTQVHDKRILVVGQFEIAMDTQSDLAVPLDSLKGIADFFEYV